MTPPSDPPHDPTMEEILASIRKIISEDQPDAGPGRGAQLRRTSSQAEILELTEEIPPEDASPPVPEPHNAAESHGTEPLISPSSRDAIDRAIDSLDKASAEYSSFAGGMFETVFARAVQDAVVPSVQQWVSGHQGELLHSAEPMVRGWIGDNLPEMTRSALAPEIGRTLHDTATPVMQQWITDHQAELMETLKPMIRGWMDQHLPQMVESVLKQEFGRAVTEHLRRRLG